MRLWTRHPRYLDSKGLVVWREGLLAQAVLGGNTVGYRHHPQLKRFQRQCIAAYLIKRFCDVGMPEPHPIFHIVKGSVRNWERVKP